MLKRRNFVFSIIATLLLVSSTIVILGVVFSGKLPPVERGRRIAQQKGCFGCHGLEGIGGTPNPGGPRPYAEIPNFKGDVTEYAEDENQIREWIRGIEKNSR